MRAAARYAGLPSSMRAWVATRLAPRLPEGEGSRDQLGRLKRFLRDGHLPLADQYERWMRFLPAEWGWNAFSLAFQEQARSVAADASYRSSFERWPSDEAEDRAMGVDLQSYLPDDLLRMGDRLSMAHSLELRVPFCDHELLAFAMALPARVRLTGWRLKGFVRRAMTGILPSSILRGPKFGFRVPLARWLRQDLREMVHDLLSDDTLRRRGYVRPDYVRWLVREHEAGTRNFADQIYALLVLELWLRAREA
jgi:asparagine synthase (glutamine-hydrolysing)